MLTTERNDPYSLVLEQVWLATPAGETTALGEPKPSSVGRVQSRVAPVQGAGMGSSLVGLVATGAGVGLVFSLIGRIF